MTINKLPHKKLATKLYKKLSQINCINNVKYLKLKKEKLYITYSNENQYIKILLKPTNYMYVNYKELLKIKKKLKSGYLLLSTNKGILTDKYALLNRCGGLILCYIKYNAS